MTVADEQPGHARPTALDVAVNAAVASVDDPEYPGISIVDLGLLEAVAIELGDEHGGNTSVTIGLIPTFSGCPALAVIAAEVAEAVERIDDVDSCTIEWLASPAWHTDRISHEARSCLAKKFTVAVQLGQRPTICPLCGSKTVEQSMFGPSRCRSVHTCTGCGETVEVFRG